VPVLLVRPGGAPVTRIKTLLVPYDGTPDSVAALRIARAVAAMPGARIVLAQVVPPRPGWDQGPGSGAEQEAGTRAVVQQALDDLARDLMRHGIPAQGRAVVGPVVESIVAVATEVAADLIVMSTHARTGLPRAVLGSVADAVARSASRPVLLIRRPAGEVLERDDVSPLASGRRASRDGLGAGVGIDQARS
jgi:nucleotide-binding universal stress UspA family protein